MKGWNPFGKVDMEIGSFLKTSVFNKEYKQDNIVNKDNNSDNKAKDDKWLWIFSFTSRTDRNI